MTNKEIKDLAWESLSGKWMIMAGLVFITMIATFLIDTSLGFFVGNLGILGSIVISSPLSLGVDNLFLQNKREKGIEGSTPSDFTHYIELVGHGFMRLMDAVKLVLVKTIIIISVTVITMILLVVVISVITNHAQIYLKAPMLMLFNPSVLMVAVGVFFISIIPAIMVSMRFILVNYIVLDNEGMGIYKAIKESGNMMSGNMMRLFKLYGRFTWWFLLVIFTAGIAALWVIPYWNMALVYFYDDIKKEGFKV